VEVIRLDEILEREAPEYVEQSLVDNAASASGSSSPSASPFTFEPRIVGLLFGDARGFSKLTEDQIPRFAQHFLGMVARELERLSNPSILRNTWGDGLYLVFDNVADAGRVALDIAETMRQTDWAAKGLPQDLSLRIGLHAGPAYACVDPVTNRPNYLGTHVSHAARIEPVTPPGQVYASAAFAALTRADRVREFRCDYVGQLALAKHYGDFPTYLVRRARSAQKPMKLV
jgi:class 3 adenylate cyclase